MTQGPEYPDPDQPGQQSGGDPYGPQYGHPYGQGQPPYGQGQPPYPQGGGYPAYQGDYPAYPQEYPGYGYGGGYGQMAPYGVHPVTGVPYSEKSKLVAGLLQLLVPFGIGRFYLGDTGIGVAQLLVTVLTCGIGGLWSFIDGIVILATDSRDAEGRPLRG